MNRFATAITALAFARPTGSSTGRVVAPGEAVDVAAATAAFTVSSNDDNGDVDVDGDADVNMCDANTRVLAASNAASDVSKTW